MTAVAGALAATLVITAAAVVAAMLVTLAVALRAGRHSVIDTVWGFGYALVAVVAFAVSAGHGVTGRRALITMLTVIWGVRLAAYIGWRSRGQGEDPRYDDTPTTSATRASGGACSWSAADHGWGWSPSSPRC